MSSSACWKCSTSRPGNAVSISRHSGMRSTESSVAKDLKAYKVTDATEITSAVMVPAQGH